MNPPQGMRVINKKFWALTILAIGCACYAALIASRHYITRIDCLSLKAQGKSNFSAGDPNYSPLLDKDHDGHACE